MNENMKPTVNERLDDVFDLESADETLEVVTIEPAEVRSSGNPERDMNYDMDFARTTMHNLIDKTNDLVDNANYYAKEKQDARAYEAAAMTAKEARENVMALIGIHKVRKEIEKVSTTVNVTGDVNNHAVFIGSTGDLLKQMKELNADGAFKNALKTIDVAPDALNKE